MKIFFEGQDRGGLEKEYFLFPAFNRKLLRDPARVAKLTGRLCFSFLWDALRFKNHKRGTPLKYDYSNSSLQEIR